MLAAGIVDLFVRMMTSLALVLAIVAMAYVVMRRRAGATAGSASAAPADLPDGSRRSTAQPRGARHIGGRRGNRPAVEVLGRVGLDAFVVGRRAEVR